MEKEAGTETVQETTGEEGLMRDARCRMQDAGCRMWDAGCGMQDAGCKMQDVRITMYELVWVRSTLAALVSVLRSNNKSLIPNPQSPTKTAQAACSALFSGSGP
ncbi:MAG: hypothetical protein WCO02_03925 [Bacteroidota bacterium]